jgi:O-antigen ligase
LSTLMDGVTVPWVLRQKGVDTIGLSRTLGIGALLALAFLLRARGVNRVALAGGLLLLALGQFWLGQRGPILALGAGVVYLLAISTSHGARLWAHRGVRYLPLGAVLAAGAIYLPQVLPRIQLDALASDPRVIIMQHWVDQFFDHPLLGIGVGAFSYQEVSDDPRAYAHNIFGELLSESGLLGFGAFLLFLVMAFRAARRARSALPEPGMYWHRISLALAVYALASAQVSGDLTTNYMVWISLALVYASAEVPRATTSRAREPYPWEHRTTDRTEGASCVSSS